MTHPRFPFPQDSGEWPSLENNFQSLRGIPVESPGIFQFLMSISADHWVRQIDGDLPRRWFLSAFLSLVISKTVRSERSARALCDSADVVREIIENPFCVRIYYMFVISKCRGDWDLGLCTTSGLRLENRCVVMTSEKNTCFDAGKIWFCHCAAVLQNQVRKLCTNLDLSLICILILRIYSKLAWKFYFLALGVCFPPSSFYFGFESTQLARQLHHVRTQIKVQ